MVNGRIRDPDYLRNDGAVAITARVAYTRIESILPSWVIPLSQWGQSRRSRGLSTRLTAASEHEVRHPLQEAGFTKAHVRELARSWNLPTWDKPASPCLSSRLAPGVPVTTERTARVEAAELYLRSLGFRECRVRLHQDELARIEVPLEGLAKLTEPGQYQALTTRFRELGFRFVTLDLEGFRSGNLNVLVSLDKQRLYAKSRSVDAADRDHVCHTTGRRSGLERYSRGAPNCWMSPPFSIAHRPRRGAAQGSRIRECKIVEALTILRKRRIAAEQVQLLFSLAYDPTWKNPTALNFSCGRRLTLFDHFLPGEFKSASTGKY